MARYFSRVRRPSADKPSSRAGKIKTWMVLDTLSYNRLQRFYLCHDDLQLFNPPEALDHYAMTYHPEIATHPTEQQRKLQAFEEWARSVFLRNVPNGVEIWQVDLSRDEARAKKTLYEDFYGIELVQWTRKIPYVNHPRREESDRFMPEMRRKDEISIQSRVRQLQLGRNGKLKDRQTQGQYLGGQSERARQLAWVQAKVQEKIATEWDAEEDGWENKRTGRCFVKMPDYCFIDDSSKQEKREPWDAFGECSRVTFHTTMQPVEERVYINFRCTLKDRPNHDFQHWRAYLYELRPMRPYDRPRDKKKRKRHPLTEEETKYEHRAKRRWSAYQRRNQSQDSTAHPRSSDPDQSDEEADHNSSDSTMSEDSSDDEQPHEGAKMVFAHQAQATEMVG